MLRALVCLALFTGFCAAQDHRDWKLLSGLVPGDKVRLTLQNGKTLTGSFSASTPEAVSIAGREIKREEVRKVEREGRGHRGKHILIGALVGFGSGFAIGAAVTGCHPNDFICISRPTGGAVLGAVGSIIGTAVGAAIPAHNRQLIYEKP